MRSNSQNREYPALMRALAARLRERREKWERAQPGRRLPITDTVSRILAHDSGYTAPRRPKQDLSRLPLLNPGIFTVAAIAAELGTTVGELLGEGVPHRPLDDVSLAERAALRRALQLVWRIFDLDDPAVTTLERSGTP